MLERVALTQLQASHEENLLRVTGEVRERSDDEALDRALQGAGWSRYISGDLADAQRAACNAALTPANEYRQAVAAVHALESTRRSVNSANRSRWDGSPPMSERMRLRMLPARCNTRLPTLFILACGRHRLAVVQLRQAVVYGVAKIVEMLACLARESSFRHLRMLRPSTG